LVTWNKVSNIDYYLINTGSQNDNGLSCAGGVQVKDNQVCVCAVYTLYILFVQFTFNSQLYVYRQISIRECL